MLEKPAFIQGVFAFEGAAWPARSRSRSRPRTPCPPISGHRPSISGRETLGAEMICLVLHALRQGHALFSRRRQELYPCASWRWWRTFLPGSVMEVLIGAPEGMKSTVVVDVGFMEIA